MQQWHLAFHLKLLRFRQPIFDIIKLFKDHFIFQFLVFTT